MNRNHNLKFVFKYEYIYLAIAILLFAYVLIRSMLLNITFDEAWTLRDFVTQSYWNIFKFTPCDANNHILNTISIKTLYYIFPNTLFVARIPNLLASFLYIFFSYKICTTYLSKNIGIICFALLLLNPFLIDYFSQARGYGLAIAFQMGSIFFLMKYLIEANNKDILKMLLFSFLSVLSVFSMLNFYLAQICILLLISLINRKKYSFKMGLIYAFTSSILLGGIIIGPILKLIESNSFYYGGRVGFYADTLTSLTQYSLYQHKFTPIVGYTLIAFFGCFAIIVGISFFKKSKIISLKNYTLSLLLLCIIAVILQFYLFSTLYVLDRGALYFYPLFILGIAFSMNTFSKNWSSNLAFFLLIPFFFNFIKNANFHKTAINFFEGYTYSILNEINEQGKKDKRIYKLDFSWPYESSINYYIHKYKFSNIQIIKNPYDRNALNLDFDYYLYLSEPLPMAEYWAQSEFIVYYKDSLHINKEYPKDFVVLYKKRLETKD